MKINKDFLLKEMKDSSGNCDYYAIAVGKTATKFRGMVKLNETAAFIWKKISEGLNEAEIVAEIVKVYEVEESIAKVDLRKIIENLREVSAIVD